MIVGSLAIQQALYALVVTLTSLDVFGTVADEVPHARVETAFEPETGRHKDGSPSAVTAFVTVYSEDLLEAMTEIKTIADGITTSTLSPTGFTVLGIEKQIRRVVGSTEPDSDVQGMRCELETIITT